MSGMQVKSVNAAAQTVLAQLDPATIAAADPATAAAYSKFEPICAQAVASNLDTATQETLLGTGRGDFRLQILVPSELASNSALVTAMANYLQAQLAIGSWKDPRVSVLEGKVLNVEVGHPEAKGKKWGAETRHPMSTAEPKLRVALAGGLEAAIAVKKNEGFGYE